MILSNVIANPTCWWGCCCCCGCIMFIDEVDIEAEDCITDELDDDEEVTFCIGLACWATCGLVGNWDDICLAGFCMDGDMAEESLGIDGPPPPFIVGMEPSTEQFTCCCRCVNGGIGDCWPCPWCGDCDGWDVGKEGMLSWSSRLVLLGVCTLSSGAFLILILIPMPPVGLVNTSLL